MKRFIILLTIGLLCFGLGSWTKDMQQFAKGVIADEDYSKIIKGRFVLKDASCAGFEFIDNKKIIWRNELTCFTPDTLAIFWLEKRTFITKDINKKSVNKDCPPRNWLYTVENFDGQNLKLKELWTGWGDYKNEIIKFTRWKDNIEVK